MFISFISQRDQDENLAGMATSSHFEQISFVCYALHEQLYVRLANNHRYYKSCNKSSKIKRQGYSKAAECKVNDSVHL